MTSIIFLLIIVAVAAALLGSVLIQSISSINDVILSPVEKKCQEIANEGYRMHTLYPNSNPDELKSNFQISISEKFSDILAKYQYNDDNAEKFTKSMSDYFSAREDDKKRLLYLDDLWMKECVSVLPTESIFNIVNNVERDFTFGE